jgi:hypothetical protein
MTRATELAYSRSYPAGVKRAFDEVLPFDLTRLLDQRYLAIPSVKAVTGQAGEWGSLGQTRTIHLSGGGSMLEELTEVTPAKRFAYHLSEITGPMKALVEGVDGAWAFERAGTGVRITWSWTVHPRGRVGELAMPAFRRMWGGSARLAFDNLEKLLVH